ncbi:MAG: fumarylacetoacetate hydrolase family protein [Phycisphaerales bacterium]
MKLTRVQNAVAVQTPEGALVIRQILAIGKNYAEHATEMGGSAPTRPVLFAKNIAALCLGGDEIVVPKICQDRPQVDFEGELAVVIGRSARDVPHDEALKYVLGYAAANDVSARWWQKDGSGGQFVRGKSFDTFCPMGSVTPAAEVGDPQGLKLVTRVNGEVMQNASTGDMLFPVATLISELSRGMTLVAGTVILTGTPSGVGMARTPVVFLKDGDVVEVEISKVGKVENRVRYE